MQIAKQQCERGIEHNIQLPYVFDVNDLRLRRYRVGMLSLRSNTIANVRLHSPVRTAHTKTLGNGFACLVNVAFLPA